MSRTDDLNQSKDNKPQSFSLELSISAKARRDNTLRLIEQHGLNHAQFAEAIGMKAPLLSTYIGKTPKKAIGNDVAKRICKYFNIDAIELDIDPNLMSSKFGSQLLHENFVNIPFYSSAEAFHWGEDLINDPSKNVGHKLIAKSIFSDLDIDEKAIVGISVSGDSMLPKIPHGARVLVDTSKNTIERDGAIYAISRGGLLSVKHLFKMPNDRIRIVSSSTDKALFPDTVMNPLDMEVEHFLILGQLFHVEYLVQF